MRKVCEANWIVHTEKAAGGKKVQTGRQAGIQAHIQAGAKASSSKLAGGKAGRSAINENAHAGMARKKARQVPKQGNTTAKVSSAKARKGKGRSKASVKARQGKCQGNTKEGQVPRQDKCLGKVRAKRRQGKFQLKASAKATKKWPRQGN
jgi:hypothetical protein